MCARVFFQLKTRGADATPLAGLDFSIQRANTSVAAVAFFRNSKRDFISSPAFRSKGILGPLIRSYSVISISLLPGRTFDVQANNFNHVNPGFAETSNLPAAPVQG